MGDNYGSYKVIMFKKILERPSGANTSHKLLLPDMTDPLPALCDYVGCSEQKLGECLQIMWMQRPGNEGIHQLQCWAQTRRDCAALHSLSCFEYEQCQCVVHRN